MGKVILTLGDDVSTDAIYPGRFMATVLPSETPRYAFADEAGLNAKLVAGEIPAGSVIVAGRNFGCGSSREQAVSALLGHRLVIVARSFARIFLQNSVNLGLVTITCPEIDAREGDDLVLTPAGVLVERTGRTFSVVALPPFRQSIVDAGGLVPYARQRLKGVGRMAQSPDSGPGTP
jgi:3-isopropylmalate/(R)-2-methylmalate dehydratase small subunit